MKLFVECEVCDARTKVEQSYDDVYIVDDKWYDHYSLGSYCPNHYPGQLDRQYGPITKKQHEASERSIGKNTVFAAIYGRVIEEQLKAGPLFLQNAEPAKNGQITGTNQAGETVTFKLE